MSHLGIPQGDMKELDMLSVPSGFTPVTVGSVRTLSLTCVWVPLLAGPWTGGKDAENKPARSLLFLTFQPWGHGP